MIDTPQTEDQTGAISGNDSPAAAAPTSSSLDAVNGLADLQAQPSQIIAGNRSGINMLNQWANQLRSEKIAAARSEVVKQAVQQYKSGDTKAAFATMGFLQPETFGKNVAQEATAYPIAYGKKAGEMNAELPSGSTPGQVETKKADAMKAKAQESEWVTRKDPNSPTGLSQTSKITGETKFTTKSGTVLQKDALGNIVPPKPQDLQPNEIWDPEANKIKTIGPDDKKALQTGITKFNSETSKMVEAINSSDQSMKMVTQNIPGMGVMEKMRALKAFTARPAVQEVLAMGKNQGIKTQLESYITQTEGKGAMGPTEQANFVRMLQTIKGPLLDEYNSLLHNRVSQISEAAHVSEGVVHSKLGKSMPTPMQEAITNVMKNGSDQDRAAVDAAQEIIKKGDINDPNYPKAKAVLKKWGFL